jgi:hypothetical protein
MIGRFSLDNRILRSINGLRYTRQPCCIIRASTAFASPLLYPTFPGFLAGERDFLRHEALPQRNSIATASGRAQIAG